jgi:hypothetical protein
VVLGLPLPSRCNRHHLRTNPLKTCLGPSAVVGMSPLIREKMHCSDRENLPGMGGDKTLFYLSGKNLIF